MTPETSSRREFLRRSTSAAGGILLGALALPREATAFDESTESLIPNPESLKFIGVQLYTVRNQMRESVERTLEQVARIGYKEVEFAGYFGRTAKEIRTILDANGLVSPSAHSADMPSIRTRLSQVIDDAAVIGQRYVICASIPRKEMTADGYKRVAEELNRAGEQAAKARIKLGFHNHADDLAPLGSTTGLDILLAATDPKVTSHQLDLFWTVKAGKEPLDYFKRYPRRFFSVHVKDMAANGAMVDVGAGKLPFAKYLARAKSVGVQHYFYEHDDPTDPMASLAAGYKHLSALKF